MAKIQFRIRDSAKRAIPRAKLTMRCKLDDGKPWQSETLEANNGGVIWLTIPDGIFNRINRRTIRFQIYSKGQLLDHKRSRFVPIHDTTFKVNITVEPANERPHPGPDEEEADTPAPGPEPSDTFANETFYLLTAYLIDPQRMPVPGVEVQLLYHGKKVRQIVADAKGVARLYLEKEQFGRIQWAHVSVSLSLRGTPLAIRSQTGIRTAGDNQWQLTVTVGPTGSSDNEADDRGEVDMPPTDEVTAESDNDDLRRDAMYHPIYGRVVTEDNHVLKYSGFIFNAKVRYQQVEDDALPEGGVVETGIHNGSFEFKLPEWKFIKEPVWVGIVSPAGEMVYETGVTGEAFKKGLLHPGRKNGPDNPWIIRIKVPATPPAPTRDDQPEENASVRVRGKLVITGAAGVEPAHRKIIIWAKPDDDDKVYPFATTLTDPSGMFSFERPKKKFVEANAEVHLANAYVVPIQLNENHLIPEKLLLVVKASNESEDTSCPECEPGTIPRLPDSEDLVASEGTYSEDVGGGKCINFTVPNRTLEEHSFYTVVRTTQPTIKGFSKEEDEPPPLPGRWKDRLRHIPGLQRFLNPDKAETGERSNQLDGASLEMLSDFVKARGRLTLSAAARRETYRRLKGTYDLLKSQRLRKPGRFHPSSRHTIDWDDEPTIYQATSISHGHLLEIKQIWKADGYSLGDLLYSLPLAPCQKKRIAIFDWSRDESAARSESRSFDERIDAFLDRDRDISEVVNATIKEEIEGESTALTGGIGMGGGGAASGSYGPFMLGATGGHAGGIGGGTSKAWQESSRNIVASSLNNLRDRIFQSANNVKNQRSTVVQSIGQSERMSVQTDVVTNHNHCHAITMEYFEVLRHFVLEQKLASVQECLFVPLLLSAFDKPKVLRWKTILSRVLLSRRYRKGFDAIERISNRYVGSGLPRGSYADQTVNWVSGDMRIRFEVVTPELKEDGSGPELSSWNPLKNLIRSLNPVEFFNDFLKDAKQIGKIFRRELGNKIAIKFTERIGVYAVLENGTEKDLNLEVNLITAYRDDVPLHASIRFNGGPINVRRKDIRSIQLRVDRRDLLPSNSRVVVESINLRYATDYREDVLCRANRVLDDLAKGDDVVVRTPLNKGELRNPREEDREASENLIDHLNEHLERYHRMIWLKMDREHRYMLLDGVIAPNAGGKSVASVVENRLIGIVGNSLVLPVAPGVHLDPTYAQDEENPVDLLEHYSPRTPHPPYRVSLPTRGVYAEAVMGACNSCETMDESRHWRFSEVPCGDEPTEIEPISTGSRRSEPGDLSPSEFPQSTINIQNAPVAPDPQGLASALQLLSSPGIFENVTGLDQNQKNAIAAMQKAMDSAQQFSSTAASLVPGGMARDIQQTTAAIDRTDLPDDVKQKLIKDAIETIAGSDKSSDSVTDNPEVNKMVDKTIDTPGAEVKYEKPGGGSVSAKGGDDPSPTPGKESGHQLGRILLNLGIEVPYPSIRMDLSQALINNSPDNLQQLFATPFNIGTEWISAIGFDTTDDEGIINQAIEALTLIAGQGFVVGEIILLKETLSAIIDALGLDSLDGDTVAEVKKHLRSVVELLQMPMFPAVTGGKWLDLNLRVGAEAPGGKPIVEKGIDAQTISYGLLNYSRPHPSGKWWAGADIATLDVDFMRKSFKLDDITISNEQFDSSGAFQFEVAYNTAFPLNWPDIIMQQVLPKAKEVMTTIFNFFGMDSGVWGYLGTSVPDPLQKIHDTVEAWFQWWIDSWLQHLYILGTKFQFKFVIRIEPTQLNEWRLMVTGEHSGFPKFTIQVIKADDLRGSQQWYSAPDDVESSSLGPLKLTLGLEESEAPSVKTIPPSWFSGW